MKIFKVFRPNLSEHYVISGTHMTRDGVNGNVSIWNDDVLIAVIPNNITVMIEPVKGT